MRKLGAFFHRSGAQVGALATGVLLCVLLCGVAQDKGLLGTQGANEVPPVTSRAQTSTPEGTGPLENQALPQTTTLRRGEVEQVVKANGTVQSSTSLDVNTSLTKRVIAVYVQKGSHINSGDILCQLDTSELDKDIEAAQAAIDRAEASDTLKLAQAERKLEQLQATLATNEAKQDTAIQEALNALDAAKRKLAEETAAATLATDAEALQLERLTASQLKEELDAIEPPEEFVNGGPNPAYADYLALVDAYTAATRNVLTLTEQYDIAWNNIYSETYETCRPTAETAAYEQAVAQWGKTIQETRQDISDTQNSVENCRLADSAATYRDTLQKKQAEREQCAITAPVSGTVTAVGARVGSTSGSRSGDALFTIQNTGSLVVEALVPEEDAMDLTINMPVTITANALEEQEWNGVVSAISPVADDDARFTVTVRFTSRTEKLAVGMTADIQTATGLRQDVFTVPHSAVVQNAEGQTVVYAAHQPGEDFYEIVVKTGIESSRKIEIEGEGLAEGLVILTNPEQETQKAQEAP